MAGRRGGTDSAVATAMVACVLVVVGVFVACVGPAQAQGGVEAYQRGDYATAAALLHREVLEGQAGEPFADEMAYLQLGLLYAQGRGVEADVVMACTFLQLGHVAARFRHHEGHANTARAAQLVHEYCDRLTSDERHEASYLMGCPVFGIRNQVVVLDLGYSIEVSRRRILVENRGVTFERSLADTLICHRQFGLIQYVRVEPPAGTTLPVRHLLEFVAWTSARPKGGLMRELTWHVREVTDSGAKIDLVAHEVLVQEAGSVWPCPSLPAEIEQGATFRMLSTGEVHWEIAGEAPRQGLIASAR